MLSRLAKWAHNKRLAGNVYRAIRYRYGLSFKMRLIFDEALRPRRVSKDGGTYVIAYPDAFYHITVEDFIRARYAVQSANL